MSTPPSPDRLRLAAGLLLIVVSGMACAADALDLRADRERQRAVNERRRIEADYTARVRQCESQFVVTSCIEEARAQRREALDRLTQQQAVIEDALRKQRAAERMERLQEKQKQAAERRDAPPAPPRVVRRGGTAASAAASAPAPQVLQLPPSHTPSAAEQQRNRAAYEKRQKDAAEHRATVEQRNALRAAEHKPAAPLPVPPAASAASR
jgi:colicin import membrane protein